jgi:hypothetical protein
MESTQVQPSSHQSLSYKYLGLLVFYVCNDKSCQLIQINDVGSIYLISFLLNDPAVALGHLCLQEVILRLREGK